MDLLKRKAKAAEAKRLETLAEGYDRAAREEARKVAQYRASLRSGSEDPAADKYMIAQHEANRLTAEHNARVHRQWAKTARQWIG